MRGGKVGEVGETLGRTKGRGGREGGGVRGGVVDLRAGVVWMWM